LRERVRRQVCVVQSGCSRGQVLWLRCGQRSGERLRPGSAPVPIDMQWRRRLRLSAMGNALRVGRVLRWRRPVQRSGCSSQYRRRRRGWRERKRRHWRFRRNRRGWGKRTWWRNWLRRHDHGRCRRLRRRSLGRRKWTWWREQRRRQRRRWHHRGRRWFRWHGFRRRGWHGWQPQQRRRWRQWDGRREQQPRWRQRLAPARRWQPRWPKRFDGARLRQRRWQRKFAPARRGQHDTAWPQGLRLCSGTDSHGHTRSALRLARRRLLVPATAPASLTRLPF
jgi:hypothetical protein